MLAKLDKWVYDYLEFVMITLLVCIFFLGFNMVSNYVR